MDIWSLGVIVYTLLIGKPPFETSDVKTTYRKIRMNDYSFPEKVCISEQAKDFIKNILVVDPLQRPSIEDLLGHPFMNSGNTIPKTLPVSSLTCPPDQSYQCMWDEKPLRTDTRTQSKKVLKPTVNTGRVKSG